MLKVAVTGGIGTGKSLVCSVFEKLGIPVFYADREAKRLMDTNIEIHENLMKSFGPEIFDEHFHLNRSRFAAIIFSDQKALETVNSIVHPVVRNEFIKWVEQQKAPYVIEEAAILFESGQWVNFDKIITVTAPLTVRIDRTINRDNSTKTEVLERIKNQFDDEFKCQHSDFIIMNDGNEMILPQIINIHNKLQ